MANRRLVIASVALVLCALLSSPAPEARQAAAQPPAPRPSPAQTQPTGTPEQPSKVGVSYLVPNTVHDVSMLLTSTKRRTRRNAAGEYTGQDYGFAFPRPRKLLPGELVHRSVLERWRDVPAYRPPNLNQDTITAMLARLQPGDGFLPYQT